MFSFTSGLNEDFQELVDRIKPEFEENLIRVSIFILLLPRTSSC